jgi:hypothetical protein
METGNPDVKFKSIAVSPDGQYAAFVGTDRLILGSVNNTPDSELTFTDQEIPMDDIINPNIDIGAAFSPDGRFLAVVSWVGDVLVWDVQASQKRAVFKMGTQELQGFEIPECAINAHSVAFTPDSKAVITSCNSEIFSWDLDSLERSTIPHAIGNTVVFALSPDGATLVTGGFEGGIHVRDFPSGDPQTELLAHSLQISSLAFSADASILASSSQDGTIDLWDARTWTRLATLEAYADFLAFSPDGKFLVTGTHAQGGAMWGVRSTSSTAVRSGVKVTLSEGAASLVSWERNVPATWLAPTGTFPRYEVRIASAWVAIESCRYDISGNLRFVSRRKSTITAQITDLETGEILDQNTFEGSIPSECPETKMFSQDVFSDNIDGANPEIDPFLPWLEDVMAGLGFQ